MKLRKRKSRKDLVINTAQKQIKRQVTNPPEPDEFDYFTRSEANLETCDCDKTQTPSCQLSDAYESHVLAKYNLTDVRVEIEHLSSSKLTTGKENVKRSLSHSEPSFSTTPQKKNKLTRRNSAEKWYYNNLESEKACQLFSTHVMVPASIKSRTASHGQMIKKALKENGGQLSFGDLLQYIRTCYTCANKSTLFVLHAMNLSLQKKLVFIFENSLVTKEMLKILQQKRESEEVEEGDSSAGNRSNLGNRFSYRILKKQLLKGSK